VLVTAAVTKFTEGAWVVLAGIPLLILLVLRIHHHYAIVRELLSLYPLPSRRPGSRRRATARDPPPTRRPRRAPRRSGT
jgi:hypothetical protein